MMEIGEKVKLLFAIFAPLILLGALWFSFAYSGVHIFRGERSDALNILNGVIQGLSTIIAIVFTIIILVVTTTVGKYSIRAIRYVVTERINILMLLLYVSTISSALWTMWNINYEFWNVWMDVTVTASFVCLGALLPFFLRIPRSLNPTIIMNEVKKEILSACKGEDFKLVSDKINLLISMIERSVRSGDVELAFGGFQILEEVIKLEDSGKNRWMFFNLMHSLLDNIGMECLEKNPNVTFRTFDVYSRILDKAKETPFIFVNVASRVEQSVVEICREALPKRFVGGLLLKGYSMIVDIYKTDVLLDYYFSCLIHVDQSLREIMKMGRNAGIFETSPFGYETNEAIKELLKKGRNEETSHMLELIFSELPTESASTKLFVIELILDSKVEGFDDFASNTLELVKSRLAPFEIEAVYDPNFGEGRSEIAVKPDGSMEIKTGSKKREAAFVWISQEMAK